VPRRHDREHDLPPAGTHRRRHGGVAAIDALHADHGVREDVRNRYVSPQAAAEIYRQPQEDV
jgi:hypothetical protein